jgi:hypothetical protein
MKTYQCQIKLQAASDTEAARISKALATIGSKLSTEVLEQLSEVVSNPLKLAIAKKQLGIS